MPIGKNQHYVPKFYLKLFSNDQKTIQTFNLKRQKSYQTSIDHICSKPYFYSKSQEIENALSSLEGSHAEIIKNVVNSQAFPVNGKEYVLLLSFLTLQHARTIKSKTKAVKMMEGFFDNIVTSLIGKNSDVKIVDPSIHLSRIKNSLQLAPLIFDLAPVLLINNTAKSFISSDNPIVFHNTCFNKIPNIGVLGLQSPGLQIFCPLGDKTMLMMYDPACYAVKISENYTVSVQSENEIDSINALQFINCDENILHSDIRQEADLCILQSKVANLIGKNRVNMKEIVINNGKERREFIQSYESCPIYDLELSFVMTNPKATFTGLMRNVEYCNMVVTNAEKDEKEYIEKLKKETKESH